MKTKTIKNLGLAAVFLLAIAIAPALAQTSKDLTINLSLLEWYDLSLSQTTINFADVAPTPGANPPSVDIAADSTVGVTSFAVIIPASGLKLTVKAAGDFDTTIPASTVSWTVSGSGYQAGTLSKTTDVTVGSWDAGSIVHYHQGTLTFKFHRDYETQEPGTYQITATFTLSKA
jgi:hypothetical protein